MPWPKKEERPSEHPLSVLSPQRRCPRPFRFHWQRMSVPTRTSELRSRGGSHVLASPCLLVGSFPGYSLQLSVESEFTVLAASPDQLALTRMPLEAIVSTPLFE